MEKKQFDLTENHVKLLRGMHVQWSEVEFGAPQINPKRPYGNSQVHDDMMVILNWMPEVKIVADGEEYTGGWSGEVDLPDAFKERLNRLHKETETALQIVLSTGQFAPGRYVAALFSHKWERVES